MSANHTVTTEHIPKTAFLTVQFWKQFDLKTVVFKITRWLNKYQPSSLAAIFDMQFRLIAEFGKNIKTQMLGESGFMTADSKMIEAIMSNQQTIQKNNLYSLLVNWLGDGLLISQGKKWFRRRKIITPAFHFKILEDFVEVFDQQSATMVQKLYDRADGKTVINMFPVACLCAMDIIAETAMGVKINAQLQPQFTYVQSVTT